MQTVRFEGWERDTTVAKGIVSTWTNYFIAGDRPEDEYDMCVVGEPDHDGPATCEVIGFRGGKQVVIFHSIEDDFKKACARAEVMTRRASIRSIE